jgi:hypothetical protein
MRIVKKPSQSLSLWCLGTWKKFWISEYFGFQIRVTKQYHYCCCRGLGFWQCVFAGQCWSFGETCSLHRQRLKWQGREGEGWYRPWRARAEGRKPTTEKEYGNWRQTNREPSGRLQGRGWVWSEKRDREREALFRAHWRAALSLQPLKMETAHFSETSA